MSTVMITTESTVKELKELAIGDFFGIQDRLYIKLPTQGLADIVGDYLIDLNEHHHEALHESSTKLESYIETDTPCFVYNISERKVSVVYGNTSVHHIKNVSINLE